MGSGVFMNDAIYRTVSKLPNANQVLGALGSDFLIDMFSKDPIEDFKTYDKRVAELLRDIMQEETGYESVDVVEIDGAYLVAFFK